MLLILISLRFPLEEGALHINFDLTSSHFPAWGGSHSTGPCSGSSVSRRCHYDQTVGACQGGMINRQKQKHQDSKKLLWKIHPLSPLSSNSHLQALGRRKDWWADWQKYRSAGGVLCRLYNTHVSICVSNAIWQICFQASAEDLTWSYANILHALHIRKWGLRTNNA